MKRIRPEESEIVGRWHVSENAVVPDANCTRIQMLTAEYLEKIAAADGGWSTLYRDPEDGRYWDLTYPHSDWHGGGPPTLIHLTDAEARSKYEELRPSTSSSSQGS